MDDKVIVTHRAALKGKYGKRGFARVVKALDELKRADKKRGLITRVVYLDDVATMKRLHAPVFVYEDEHRAAKEAVDGVFKALKPDYLMILGAPDVIPHQDLNNPAYEAGDDDDAQAWGDLPYACDTPYGRDPAQFVGPTRVVGRLPDLTGATEPSHLIALLKIATNWKSRDLSEYQQYFGLSTFSWQRSSRNSLRKIFGNNSNIQIAPPKGPRYRNGELGARVHFINCHGADQAPYFEGQKGLRYGYALTTEATQKSIREGTVAAMECCYGAQLYNAVALEEDIPICQSYLRQGSYGYLGSTTIAYGPATPPAGSADLVCQFFLRNVLDGASIGRAALMARQQFVQECEQTDPMDLKTLAQFCLYGDPSVQPVCGAESVHAPARAEQENTDRFRRRERRERLKQTGEFLKDTKPTASKREKGARMAPRAKRTLAGIAAREGLPRGQKFVAFPVKGAKPVRRAGARLASAPHKYYLAIGKPGRRSKHGHRHRVVVIAKELNGRIIDSRVYYER